MHNEFLSEVFEKLIVPEGPCSKIVFISVLDEKCLVEVIKFLTETIDLHPQYMHNIIVTGIWSWKSFENEAFRVLDDDICRMIAVYMYSESKIIEEIYGKLSSQQISKISHVDCLVNRYFATEEPEFSATRVLRSDKFKSKQQYELLVRELNEAISVCAKYSKSDGCKIKYQKTLILLKAIYDHEEEIFKIDSISAGRLILDINELCTFHIQDKNIPRDCIQKCRNILRYLTDIFNGLEYTKTIEDSISELEYFTKMINARYFKTVMDS